MYAVELHAHSSLSHDGRDDVELLLEQAAAVGLDALAVTDHDVIDASLRAVDLAPEYDLVGIPGMEVTSAAGHVLALGVTESIDSGQSFAATIDAIHDQGGIAVVPHPYQSTRQGVLTSIGEDELCERADAIEVYNSRLLTGRANRKARALGRRCDVPMTAGSDAHISEMVGQARTYVDACECTVEALLPAIADGRTTVDGRRTPWRISFRQAAGGVRRRVRRRVSGLLD